MELHEWLLDMLDQLTNYARDHGLEETEVAISSAWRLSYKEITRKHGSESNVYQFPISVLFQNKI